ncbi:subclass B1 metallo-beta-lactamase [Hugenholtzia roseola]|uniref:subclass B1 metallo-beta-lactamase n=1 Tax=Hugenholtzia roseola TaxID=1002 RepID=UPI00040A4A5F|nr:subclass B1 metallo-beta-lactamase [Hugenholtzia roseola]
MRLNLLFCFVSMWLLLAACQKTRPLSAKAAPADSSQKQVLVLDSPELQIYRLTPHTFVHISYLQTQSWGKVACNGLVYLSQNQALIMDTPTDSLAAERLINWLEKEKAAQIKGVIINHFHNDCLGSLSIFHRSQIPSYASAQTLNLAKANGQTILPQNTFEKELILYLDSTKKEAVRNLYLGAAHTQDNIVSFVEKEKVLFGGCMVKALDASKGNLADADTLAWSETIQKVKQRFPQVQYVVPGHGESGNRALLDYTYQLFLPTQK